MVNFSVIFLFCFLCFCCYFPFAKNFPLIYEKISKTIRSSNQWETLLSNKKKREIPTSLVSWCQLFVMGIPFRRIPKPFFFDRKSHAWSVNVDRSETTTAITLTLLDIINKNKPFSCDGIYVWYANNLASLVWWAKKKKRREWAHALTWLQHYFFSSVL